MEKKAQIQMMETIATIFIFFILIVLGLIFYFNIATSETEGKIEKFQELSKIQVAQIASSLPELQCSQKNVLSDNCLDILKLEVSSDVGGLIYDNQNQYFDLFAYARIRVQQVFPISTQEWTVYDSEPDTIYNKLTSFFPISLYNATADTYAFGLMVVEVYP